MSRTRLKKWPLVVSSLAMAAWFGLLAVAWRSLAAGRPDLLAVTFLVLYGLFSASNGVNQLLLASVQGKLVPAGRRGRTMVVSVAVGSVLAILAAVALLGPWLDEQDGFPKIFAVTALFFGLAAMLPALLDEPPDGSSPETLREADGGGRPRAIAAVEAWRATLAGDPALLRTCLVAACFSAVLMLFPHYQAFARDRLGSPIGSLLTWVCVQNAATGLASLVAGPGSAGTA